MHELDQGHHTRGRPQKSHIDCNFWEQKQTLSLSLTCAFWCYSCIACFDAYVSLSKVSYPCRSGSLATHVTSFNMAWWHSACNLQFDMTWQVAWQEFSIRVFLTHSNSKFGKDKSHLVSCNTTMTDCDDNNCHILNIIPILCIEPVRPGMWIQQMLQELQTEIS